jgi:hypothetical protein
VSCGVKNTFGMSVYTRVHLSNLVMITAVVVVVAAVVAVKL